MPFKVRSGHYHGMDSKPANHALTREERPHNTAVISALVHLLARQAAWEWIAAQACNTNAKPEHHDD